MATIAAVTLVGAATSAETRVTAAGPDWLPLKGKYKNAIGCTWNNGCESPTHGYHSPRQAIDFTVGVDVPVYAAGPGQVEIAWDTCGEGDVACGPGTSRFGNAVAIRHPDGRYSWYAHLSQVLVGEGSDVAAGDLIGKTGNTGESFGAHLHYEEHQGSPWGNTVPPGPMRAYHGADLVSYPDVLGAKAWQDLGCGKQQGEAGCKEKWLIQNDGYKPTKAGGGGGGSGGGSGGSAKSGKCTTNRLGVVFILDDSGSNQATDPRYLRADAARVALSYLPEGTLVSALKFSDSAQTVVPATRLTDRNESPIADTIRSRLATSGSTNYESSFQLALQHLGAMRRVQRIIIFLSDGQPTSSYSSNHSIASQNIPIYTVGYGPVRNLPVLINIASESHAKYSPINDIAEASIKFSDFLQPYLCNTEIGSGSKTLRPGRQYSRTFDVAKGSRGISALATWTTPTAPKIWLVRPDGKRFENDATARWNERVEMKGQQARRFDVGGPEPGTWKIVAVSDRWVSLSFEVWKTQKAPIAFKYVALGDSFSSGEGIEPYFRDGFTDSGQQPGDVDNRCHRATRAYAEYVTLPWADKPIYVTASGGGDPGKRGGTNKYGSDADVRAADDQTWVFWACSGAVTDNVLPEKLQRNARYKEAHTQLDYASVDKKTDLVTITIGGNDALFVDVLVTCSAPNCNQNNFGDHLVATIDNLRPRLTKVYEAIKRKAPNARVLVVGYPQIFPASLDEQRCRGLRLWSAGKGGEQELLRRAGTELNTIIEKAAGAAKVEFVAVEKYFAGHEVCGTDGSWLNPFDFTLTKAFRLTFTDDESFHPTVEGQQKGFAAAVNDWLRTHKPLKGNP